MLAFRNESELSFEDISSEEWREYLFPGGNVVRIDGPLKIHMSDRGHRIFDASSNSYFIPAGWIQLKWKAKEGEPHFVI